MMLEVLNVSNRSITISGVRIAPLKRYTFDENNLSTFDRERINSLATLGLVRIRVINSNPQPTITNINTEINNNLDDVTFPKKSTRKSK